MTKKLYSSRMVHDADSSKADEGVDSVLHSLESGVTFIDTSRAYGDVAVLIVKALKNKVPTNAKISFKDAEEVPSWAVPYVATALEANLLMGRGSNKFVPLEIATRAEAAQVIFNLIGHMK